VTAILSCGSTPVTAGIAGARRSSDSQRFGALFHAQQHPPRHDKRRRLHDAHEEPCTKRVRKPLSAARYQSRTVVVEWIEAKLPNPLKAVRLREIRSLVISLSIRDNAAESRKQLTGVGRASRIGYGTGAV
jgi:hypothetical protein